MSTTGIEREPRKVAIPTHQECPYDALPSIARNAFLEIRQNIQTNDAVIMTALLTAMAASCQSAILAKSPNAEPHHVTLYGLIGSDSGTGKTKVYLRVFAPFLTYVNQCINLHKTADTDYATELAVWESKLKGLRERVTRTSARAKNPNSVESYKAEAEAEAELRSHLHKKPTEPKLRLMMKCNISASAMIKELNGDGQSALWVNTECHKFLSKLNSDVLDQLSDLWDGTTLTYERLNYRFIATNPHVTHLGMTQPLFLRKFFMEHGELAIKSGLLPRHLIAIVPTDKLPPGESVMDPVWPSTDTFGARITELLIDHDRSINQGAFSAITLEFSDDAKQNFMKLLGRNREQMALSGCWGGIKEFVLKEPENIARIAAILHFFSEQPGTRISANTLEDAIAIADWYMEQAKLIFVTEKNDQLAEKLISFLYANCYMEKKHLKHSDTGLPNQVPPRHVMQYFNIGKSDLYPLLKSLADRNIVEMITSLSGKQCIHLNDQYFRNL